MYTSIKNVKYVDANLNAPDNAISEMFTSQSQLSERAKTGNAEE